MVYLPLNIVLLVHVGREFEAIFLSTFEPTEVDGMPKNPTKSPCSQYVFNTALTRAKSLVVCAGNPFLLMKMEKHMKNEVSCWKNYIRRCVVSKTFYIPEKVVGHIKVLQNELFDLGATVKSQKMADKDSILNSFQKALKKLPRFRYSKLQIIQEQNNSFNHQWGIVNDNNDPRSYAEDYNETVTCELQIRDQRSAMAIPLDTTKKTITINGFNNRKGAFDGDTVEVHVIGTEAIDDKLQDYGKVVKVKEAQHPTRYVCRGDPYCNINFIPLDKTAPVIVNLPKISTKLLHNHSQVDPATQKDYITIFEESSLSVTSLNDKIPQIKELIPFQISHTLLFVVQLLGWNPKYRKALGAVIEAIPRTSNLFFTERVLKLAHNVEENYEHNIPSPEVMRVSSEKHYNRAITIDPPGAKDLDDAISLLPILEDTYELAVLITNVAKYIHKDDELDSAVKTRGTSVFTSRPSTRVFHMFPENFATKLFSLTCGTTHEAIAVTATVKVKDGKVIDVHCHGPSEATVTSQIQLTYEVAQNVFSGIAIKDLDLNTIVRDFDSVGNSMSLSNTLKLLFQVAMKLRIDRLKDAAFYYVVSEQGEETCWQMHLLIEELMIWTNEAVANYLLKNLPSESVVLRSQKPPPQDDIDQITFIHQSHINHSLALTSRLKVPPCRTLSPFIIPHSTLLSLTNAFKENNITQLLWLLANDNMYPQASVIHSMLKSVKQSAKYVLAANSDDNAHYDLLLKSYVHFTSPIRRYFDIIVQRLVTAVLNNADIHYTKEDLLKICCHLNVRSKMSKKFQQLHEKTILAQLCEMSLQKVQVCLVSSLKRQNQFKVYVSSGEFSCLRENDVHFDDTQLNIKHKVDSKYTWHVVSISVNGIDSIALNDSIEWFSEVTDARKVSQQCIIDATVYHYNEGSQDLHCSFIRAPVASNVYYVAPEVSKLAHQCLKHCKNEDVCNLFDSLPPVKQTVKQKSRPLFYRSSVVMYDIEQCLSAGSIVNVWFGRSLKDPIAIPSINLLEISPTVQVCIQHNQNPSLCFSDVRLNNASIEWYSSIEKYMNLWSKVYVAEAAYDGIKTKQLVFLRNAILHWPELVKVNNCIDHVYYQPKGELSVIIPEDKLDALDFVNIKSGDFVCTRYEIPVDGRIMYSVYHFVVTETQTNCKKANQVIIKMIAEGDQSCQVSSEIVTKLKTNSYHCELQVIAMPDSFQ